MLLITKLCICFSFLLLYSVIWELNLVVEQANLKGKSSRKLFILFSYPMVNCICGGVVFVSQND